MKDNSTQQLRHLEEVFDDVLGLYAALQSSHSVCVRRAQLNLRGEVPAEPIDFICDVDIKAKRAGYFIPLHMIDADIPRSIKQVIGKAFLAGGLHVDGPYKTLYFRVKNQAARNSMTTNEVPLASGVTVNEGD